MNDPLTPHTPDTEVTHFRSEWPIKLIGGKAVGKFQWYLRLAGLIFLGLLVSIALGVVVGVIANNGDAAILVALFLFIASVFVALIYVRRRVVRTAVLQLDNERFNVVDGSKTVASWSCKDIGRVHCDMVAQGVGLAAAIPSGFDRITVEHKNDSIVFQMHHEAALDCVEAIKAITRSTVYTGPMTEAHVPTASDRPEQVWRTQLRSEFRSALSQIAFGLFGSAYLCLFVYGVLTRQQPQGQLGFLLLMIVVALFGPFLLYIGIRGLFTYFSRRRRFAKLSKNCQTDAINDLISEIYGELNSSQNNTR